MRYIYAHYILFLLAIIKIFNLRGCTRKRRIYYKFFIKIRLNILLNSFNNEKFKFKIYEQIYAFVLKKFILILRFIKFFHNTKESRQFFKINSTCNRITSVI